MLNFFLADRVKELTHTTGTGSFNLEGAVAGFSSFGDIYASGDVVFYAATDNVQYEVGSGIYEMNGSNRSISRHPIRSSNVNIGPYYVNGTSNNGVTSGQTGRFHPLWLSRSSALSGVGVAGGPFTAVSGFTFDEFPGQTFYYTTEHAGSGEPSHAGLSGVDFNASGAPVNFTAGVKEIFVTYPGKSAVLNAYGVDASVAEPKRSGIAVWENEQVIDYDGDLLWDGTNKLLSLKQPSPSYAIDVGGDIGYSTVQASGFKDGGSGILFAGVAGSYSGGRQLEPFLRNELGSGAQGVIAFSGLVDEGIGFAKQVPKTVFMGPSGECGCTDDFPTFRLLRLSDLPLSEMDGKYVVQSNLGVPGSLFDSANIEPNPFVAGMVAIYHSSGNITYDSGLFYDNTKNSLLVAGNAKVDKPEYQLDVRGELSAQSGYFNQVVFRNDLIRIGSGTSTNLGNAAGHYNVINVGNLAGTSSSGLHDVVLVGRSAGEGFVGSSGAVVVGYRAGYLADSGVNPVSIGREATATASGFTEVIAIGTSAGYGVASGNAAILIGSGAGVSGSGFQEVVAIGNDSFSNRPGNNLGQVTKSVAIGSMAANQSSGHYVEVVAIGSQVLQKTKNVKYSIAIGSLAAEMSSGIEYSVAIGNQSLEDSFDFQHSTAIGNLSAQQSSGVYGSTFIGYKAGQKASGVKYDVGLGWQSAMESSGTHNIYVGYNAGANVSGHENIEIIGSGSGPSFLGVQASGKVNIAKTIVADIYSGNVGVGHMTDASPPATLYVRPSGANDSAFILRHQGSGSQTPYFQLQSGDGTTFYHITNSGSVITSGFMSPSGGLNLPSVPKERVMINSGVGGYMLWNNAGTLIWNGSSVGGAGGYSNWKLGTGTEVADSIESTQTVIISGVSGIETQYNAASNHLTIGCSGLSGVLQQQISAATYTFDVAASGAGARNHEKVTINSQNTFVVSGVSGINIDVETRVDGTSNNSGIFVISYDPTSTFSFSTMASGEGSGNLNRPFTMVNGAMLAFSGVSGVGIDFLPFSGGGNNSGIFVLGANDLSGVLQSGIDHDFAFWSGEAGFDMGGGFPINVSGVSGIAAYASGQADAFTQLSATSGIRLQNSTYILDHSGSGFIQRLYAVDRDAVIIGHSGAHNATHFASGVIIGSEAGVRASGNARSIMIGPKAGLESSGNYGSIMIGHSAGMYAGGAEFLDTKDKKYNTWLGYEAGMRSLRSDDNVAIGFQAMKNTSGINKSNMIGFQAGFQTSGVDGANVIGKFAFVSGLDMGPNVDIHGSHAVTNASGFENSVAIGYRAGESSSGICESTFIGLQAGQSAEDMTSTIAIGHLAGNYASGVSQCVFIGHGAGSGVSGVELIDATHSPQGGVIAIGHGSMGSSWASEQTVAIGKQAGAETSGAKHSVFLGPYAGKGRSGTNNLIISARSTGTISDFDASWCRHDMNGIVDIVGVIQGVSQSLNGSSARTNIHLGRSFTQNAGNYESCSDILGHTLVIEPAQKEDTALKLAAMREAVSGVINESSYMKTEPYVGTTPARNSSTPDNAIINRYGYLEIPVMEKSDGLGANAELYDLNGNVIPKVKGAIAAGDGYNGAVAGSVRKSARLFVAVDNDDGTGLTWMYADLNEIT